MSILIVSPDAEAARSLTSALGRSGHRSMWDEASPMPEPGPRRSRRSSSSSTGTSSARELIDHVSSLTPWVRVYEMADSAAAPDDRGRPVLRKPFDAAELANLLGREQELAELDRQKHTFEAQAEELALLVEASFEAIIGLGPTGVIRSWNRGAASIYGYTAKEIIGRSSRPFGGNAARRDVEARERRRPGHGGAPAPQGRHRSPGALVAVAGRQRNDLRVRGDVARHHDAA